MGKRLKKFISVTTTIAFVCSISLTFAEETQDLSPPEELINGEIDEDEVVVENVYINFANGVMEEKGWLPELAPGTGDTLVAGGVVVAALAAGGLLVVNRKNKKDEE